MKGKIGCLLLFLIAAGLRAQVEKKRSAAGEGRVLAFDSRWLTGGPPTAGSRVVNLSGKPEPGERAVSSVDARMTILRERGRLGISADTAGQLKLLRQSGHSTDFQQTIANVPVFEGHFKVTFDQTGETVAVTLPAAVPERVNRVLASLAPADAVLRAFKALGLAEPADLHRADRESAIAFENPLGAGYDPIEVELVAFPLEKEMARLAWRVLVDGGKGRRAEIVIDAVDARMLYRHSLERASGSGKVWRTAPDKGDRVLVGFPDGWLGSGQTSTNGNNADVYLDTDGNNQPDTLTDAGIRLGRAFADNQIFDFPAPDPNGQDDPRKFRAAGVTNAFYFVNTAHDFFFGLGFDEAAGNFQRDNGGKGGLANDAFRVEVQDRFETNNAHTTITRDGSSPRMEVGIFDRGTAAFGDDRDMAYDGQTLMHEYTHGVTNRSVGGGTSTSCLDGTQSGALDEGWADYYASSFFSEPLLSPFFSLNMLGIRRRSYEGYPFTYEDLGNDGFEVHRDGEIWAATLWDLRKALGRQIADKLVYAALRATPCRPTFTAARDAILATDEALNKSANRAKIWLTFARRGLGASAGGEDGAVGLATVFNAAFDLPNDLQSGNRNPVISSLPPTIVAGRELFTYRIQAQDPDGGTLRYELLQGPAGMTVDGATGVLRWNTGFLQARVKVAITDGQGGRVIHGFQVSVLTALRPGQPATVSVPTRGEVALVGIDVPAGTPVLQLTSRGGTGDVDLGLVGPGGEIEIAEPRTGQFETYTVGNPSPGRWIGFIVANRAFEDATITATLPVPRLIKGNDSLLGLAGDPSSETFYRVIIPPGGAALTVRTSGGSGDVDVVVAREMPPACQSFEESFSFRCSAYRNGSYKFGNNELVQVDAPQPGNWYINLTSAAGYVGLAMSTEMPVRPTLVLDRATMIFNAWEGAIAPPSQTLKLSDSSGTKFEWTVTVNPAAPWLRLSAEKGSGDSDLTLTALTQGLAQGTYRTSLTLNGAGLGQSPQSVAVVLNYTRPAPVTASAQQLNFTGPAGSNPPGQLLEFSRSGGGAFEWTVTAATASGGNWLAVDQERGTGNAKLQVSVRAGALAAGTYDGTLTIAATGAPNVTVRVRYVAADAFSLTEDSLRSLSSQLPGRAISPGDLVIVQGVNLVAACSTVAGAANPCPVVTGYPLPTELGGLQVRVNGVAAPLVSVSPTEVRFIVPFETVGPEAGIVAARGSAIAPAIVRQLEPQSIGVFTVIDGGAGAARMYHSDGALVSRALPLVAEETITIQTSGLGAVNPLTANGSAAPADPLATVVIPVVVYFDGREGRVDSAYLEPGAAGFYRVKVAVPAGLSRKFPMVQVQSLTSQSREVSAGGPSLADVPPASVSKGADAQVTLRGINLVAGAAVKIGDETMTGELTDGPVQSLRVTIPARLLADAADLELRVVDPTAPDEAASNAVVVRVR